jgi:molybdenum cofactor guanylyltransferase
MDEISAFILAGGRSLRMGSDKAFLELDGNPLIARAVQLARQVASSVKIVGDAEKHAAYAPVISDTFRGRGPLAGIHAALIASSSNLNLILAVDLPFMSAQFLKYLIVQASASHATVTVPSSGGYFQPLCAVYRKQFAQLSEQSLSEGRNKIDALFPGIILRTITQEELKENGFSQSIFRNLNTQEDWNNAKLELEPK